MGHLAPKNPSKYALISLTGVFTIIIFESYNIIGCVCSIHNKNIIVIGATVVSDICSVVVIIIAFIVSILWGFDRKLIILI